jgi:DNA-binding NarL/FixJ family response regulator
VLVDGSLVRQREGADGESRFDMLVTIREYGLDRLAATGELAPTRQRLADWCLELVEGAWPSFARRADQERWLDQLEVEHDNLRAALTWSDESGLLETVLRLSGGLFWFWYVRGYLGEGRGWLERALTQATEAPADARARALLGLGVLTHWQGDDQRAVPCLEESLALWQDSRDDWGISFTLIMLGVIAEDTGDFTGAIPYLERGLDNARSVVDRPNVALALDHLGVVAWGGGDATAAIPYWQEALQIHRETGDTWGASISLSYLGMTASESGEYATAEALLRESLQQRWDIGTKEDIAHGLANFGALAAAQGQASRAARLFGAAEAIQEAIGNQLKEPERSFYERAIARTRTSLNDRDYAAAWSAGRALSIGDAVAEALAPSVTLAAPEVPESRRRADVAYGLTARELEVLPLIVAGQTDRQIAEALYISPRTAQVHVASILAKLDVATRAAAAALATREHLVAMDS